MKKRLLMAVFLVFLAGVSFGDTGEQEEVNFLLFLPNSGDQFADTEQAMAQLDATAHYLRSKNLGPGQIYVYGYTAVAANDIEPIYLSRERALFVINELQKRGLASDLFAAPVAYGSVDFWGSNAEEEDRSPNRRVRIVLEGTILTPTIVQTAEPEPEPVPEQEPIAAESPLIDSSGTESSPSAPFPWWIPLLVLLIAAIIFAALKRKKSAPGEPKPQAPVAPVPKPEKPPVVPDPVIPVPVVKNEKIRILTEEEIRHYAYGLYKHRHGHNGDAVGDWHQAIHELTAHYEAQGYRVMLYWEAQ